MTSFTESIVEEATLAVLGRLDWALLKGPEIAAGTPAAERSDPGYRDVILERRLRAAIARLNPALPASARSLTMAFYAGRIVLAGYGWTAVRLSASATRAAGDDTADRAELHGAPAVPLGRKRR